MYGLAIKLWSSEFDKKLDEYKIIDSVAYLCNDVANRDILYLSTVINHLVGDDSLDEIFRKHVPIVKGETISWDEPLIKLEQPEYDSENEDNKLLSHHSHDSCSDNQDVKKEIKSKFQYKAKKRKKADVNDYDFTVKKSKKWRSESGSTLASFSQPGTCHRCDKLCSNTGALIAHLKKCNPEQLNDLPEKTKHKKTEGKGDGHYVQEYNCSYCERKFRFKKSLEKHEYLHITDPDGSNSKRLRTQKQNVRCKYIIIFNIQYSIHVMIT